MKQTTDKSKPQPRLTVLLSDELAQRLQDEKKRIEAETGFTVSMTQVASRAMEKGLCVRLPQ